MKTQYEESLSLPKFEDRLWAELSQLHGTQMDANEPEHRSPRRRYLVAAAVMALAGLGAGVAAVVTADRPPDTTTEPAEAGKPARPPDAVVVEEHRQNGLVTSRSWLDESTGNRRGVDYGANGDLRSETGGTAPFIDSDGNIAMRSTGIDHVRRKYFQDEETYAPEHCPPDAFPPGEDSCIGPPGAWRQDDLILMKLEGGGLVQDGFETVDGRELLRLVMAHDGNPIPERSDVWLVDPETYRPVEQRLPGTGDGYTITYEYLERTPENLELLDIEIPEGYSPYGLD